MSVEGHRSTAPAPGSVRVAIITVSDTRTLDTDQGGPLISQRCADAGFSIVDRSLLRDDAAAVTALVERWAARPDVDAVILTGGTGLAARDTTVDALARLFDRTLPGFGELFRALSFTEIGPAAMLSRATAGTIGRCAVFATPGSPGAVRLALDKLIIPELPHLVRELRRDGAVPGPPHEHRAR